MCVDESLAAKIEKSVDANKYRVYVDMRSVVVWRRNEVGKVETEGKERRWMVRIPRWWDGLASDYSTERYFLLKSKPASPNQLGGENLPRGNLTREASLL